METNTNKKKVNKCGNCHHWRFHAEPNLGLCLKQVMAFAYTCERTLHPITKSFYVCDEYEKAITPTTVCTPV